MLDSDEQAMMDNMPPHLRLEAWRNHLGAEALSNQIRAMGGDPTKPDPWDSPDDCLDFTKPDPLADREARRAANRSKPNALVGADRSVVTESGDGLGVFTVAAFLFILAILGLLALR